jgi:pyridinium-3,5-bisthiocarboxylic acid mononucleotide nickel chelatase
MSREHHGQGGKAELEPHDHEHGHAGAHRHTHGADGAHQHGSEHDHGNAHHHAHDEPPQRHDHRPDAGRHAHHDLGFRVQSEPPGWRHDREPGFGAGKVLHFDAFSGIAGDMTVAALVDLGVPCAVVRSAVSGLGLDGVELHFRHGYVGSIGALQFDVEIGKSQGERSFAVIDRILKDSALDAAVRATARAIFRRLAEAEAAVHRTAVEEVHFHEVGAVDSIADIVGAAACIEHIGATVCVSPLPMGRGFIECRHGTIPLPAPATVNCLAGIITRDAGIEAELVTPTGAAIIGTVAKRCEQWPRMAPIAVGWGAGSRVLPDRPNLLRVVLGDADPATDSDEASAHVVIEANVDDATGELAGHALGLLLEQGALDAWAVPITMKKGRPGVVLSAIVGPTDEARLTALLIRETTTLGVRRHLAGRTVRPRRMIEVETRYGTIPVKVSEGPFGPPQVKPEFDHCARVARQIDVPVREVLAEAIGAARRALGMGDNVESS